MDVVLFEYTDITLKIKVNEDEVFYRDIEHIDATDEMMIIVREFGAGIYHIEHRNWTSIGNGIGNRRNL